MPACSKRKARKASATLSPEPRPRKRWHRRPSLFWKELYDQTIAIPETIRALAEKLNDIDAAQMQAITAKRKEIITARARIRADAAAECPRPVLGPNAPGPMTLRDNFWLAATLAVEALQKAVIHENALDARRNSMIVNINPAKVEGRTVVDATAPAWRHADA